MVSQYLRDLKREFRGYNAAAFVKDLFAGLTACAVALPLALAFGVSSGATAAAGLITAIIAGFVISALSGASYQISGPTGAMTAVLVPVAQKLGMQGIFIVCLMAGALLVAAGVLKLGRLVSFIPQPVIAGFTTGIAVIIALGQLDNFLGVKITGENQISRVSYLFGTAPAVNLTSVLIALGVMVLMFLYPKKLNGIFPSSLFVIILAVALNKAFAFPVVTIGNIPQSLILPERLHLNEINFSSLNAYLLPAISVACLGMVESLLCGACAGTMKGEKMDANRELVAQGIGNMLIPFFGGVPATAAIARTSVAIKAGNKTRLTGIIHAAGLVLSMLALGSVMADIPLCALSGVLMVTAWRMNEWKVIVPFFKKGYKTVAGLYAATMVCTVLFDLTSAIVIGVLLAMATYVVKSCDVNIVCEDVDLSRVGIDKPRTKEHKNWGVVYMAGSLFFMTSGRIYDRLAEYSDRKLLILSMRGVSHADVADVSVLAKLYKEAKQQDRRILFSSVQPHVFEVFKRAGLVELAGEDSFYFSADKAILDLL